MNQSRQAVSREVMGNRIRESEKDVLIFQIGSNRCGLPAECVREVIHLPHLSRPPGTPRNTAGFFNLGGHAIPVVELGQLLGFSECRRDIYTPLLLVEVGDVVLGMLVSLVEDMVRVDTAAGRRVAEDRLFNDTARCVLELEGQTVHLLDPGRILLQEELRRLSDFRALEQGRLEGASEASGR